MQQCFGNSFDSNAILGGLTVSILSSSIEARATFAVACPPPFLLERFVPIRFDLVNDVVDDQGHDHQPNAIADNHPLVEASLINEIVEHEECPKDKE